jgi:hypothetical protein
MINPVSKDCNYLAVAAELQAQLVALQNQFNALKIPKVNFQQIVNLSVDSGTPIESSFTSTTDNQIFFFAGSGYHNATGAAVLQAQVLIDNELRGEIKVCANDNGQHKTYVPIMFHTQLTAGTHSLRIQYGTATKEDVNDFFTLSMIEF